MTGPPDIPPRDRFSPAELRAALVRYPIGRVASIRPLHKGEDSPKVVVDAEEGRFLLKRRPAETPAGRVAASHELQLALFEAGFPTPALVGTADANNSMLQLGGRIYELFRFVEADPPANTAPQAAEAGAALARLHALASAVGFTHPLPARAAGTATPGDALPGDLSEMLDLAAAAPAARGDLAAIVEAGERAGDALRGERLREAVLHGDWHPGNTLWRGATLAAVVDFDDACRGPWLEEVAIGAFHFGAARPPADDDEIVARLDYGRVGAFWQSYRAQARRLGPAGLLPAPGDAVLLPWLMIRVLIREALPRAVRQERVGVHGRPAFLGMIAASVTRLTAEASVLSDALSPG